MLEKSLKFRKIIFVHINAIKICIFSIR